MKIDLPVIVFDEARRKKYLEELASFALLYALVTISEAEDKSNE